MLMVLVGVGVADAGDAEADPVGGVVSVGAVVVWVLTTPGVQPASRPIARTQLARCLRR
jgi:hypothetical protein